MSLTERPTGTDRTTVHPPMELHQLRYFVAVAEELSFRRAAERLRICQPPLSRQIKALEAELGVRLFKRSRGSRIALTDAGRTFLADARQVLKGVETARQHAAAAARGVRGRLVIANSSAVSFRLSPACLKQFHRAFPQVELSIVEMNNPEKLSAIYEQRVHIGLFTDYGFSAPPEFECKLLLDVPILAVVPPGHPISEREAPEIDVKSLDGQTLLHPPTGQPSCYTKRIPGVCQDAGVTPSAVQAVGGLENVLAMVAAGYGVGILPDILGDTLRDAFRCKRLRLPTPPYQFYAVWLRGTDHAASKNLLKIASQVAGDEQRSKSAVAATATTRLNGVAKHFERVDK